MDALDIERQTMLKVWRKIVPLMAGALFCSLLDKVNIGFAALQMNQALGFSNTVFGAGAGFFAIGYALFGIPSTLLLHRMGARRWIALIMIAWGVASAATAFVTSAEGLFGVRFLLGMAEAGFSPGAMLYFCYWFPNQYRGRVLGTFLVIQPLGLIIGGPLSSVLFSCDGMLGLAGWQWLFIIEALPTVILALVVFFILTDRPADARWLSSAEKGWIEGRLAAERQHTEGSGGAISAWRTLADKRVWIFAIVCLGISTGAVGIMFFLPLMIRSSGFSLWNTGFVAAVPGIFAALLLPLWGVWTDRSRHREIVVATGCCVIAAGLLGTAALLPSPWAVVPISVAIVGFYGCMASFWTLPQAMLTGASAAAGIAFINIAGNLAVFTGPAILGWTSDLTGSYGVGLNCLAFIALGAAAVMAAQAMRNRKVARAVSKQIRSSGE